MHDGIAGREVGRAGLGFSIGLDLLSVVISDSYRYDPGNNQ